MSVGQSGEIDVHFRPRASFALLAVLTAGVHAASAYNDEAHGWRVPVFDVHHLDHIEAAEAEAIGSPSPATRRIEVPVLGEDTEVGTITIRVAEAPYARQFDDDPAANEVDQGVAKSLPAIIQEFRDEGWEQISVTLKGQASAEDDSTDSAAGLISSSAPNERLAALRATRLNEYINANGLVPADIPVVLESQEDQFNAKQVEILQAQVDQFGYASITRMIDDWNLGKPVPPEVDQALTNWLANKRGVLITVTGTKLTPGPEGTEIQEERVCVVPVREVDIRHETTTPWKLTLPWLIPFPVFWGRRKKTSKGSLDNELEQMLRANRFSGLGMPGHLSNREIVTGLAIEGSGGGLGGGPVKTMPVERVPRDVTSAQPDGPVQAKAPNLASESKASTPDSIAQERKKRRWPWLVPLLPVAAGSFALTLYEKDDSRSGTVQPVPTEVSCANLPVIEEVSGPKKTIVMVNGEVERVDIQRR